MMRTACRIAGMALLAYVGMGLLLYAGQKRFIYFPTRTVRGTPGDIGLDFEALTLTAADGVAIAAWFVPAPPGAFGLNEAPAVLFCHGNAGNIGDRLTTIETFHRLGLSVMIFDYHGYGESEGRPGEEETYLAAQAAWKHLTDERGLAPDRIAVFGRSLGGGVAAWLAARYPPGLLIVESTMTCVTDMAARMYPFYPARLLTRMRYDTLARMETIRAPVIVAHSREDEMIPFEHGQRLYQAAREPKTFIELQGLHNESGIDVSPGYRERVREWVAKHMADAKPSADPS